MADKNILDYLKTTDWSITDYGWQEDSNDSVKASYFEREAFDEVLEYFTQKIFSDNFIILTLKELKNIDYEIELEENTDSFGEVLNTYYPGDSEIQSYLCGEMYDKEEFFKKFNRAYKQLETFAKKRINDVKNVKEDLE